MLCFTLCGFKEINKFSFFNGMTAIFEGEFLEGSYHFSFRKQPNTGVIKTEVFCDVKLWRMVVPVVPVFVANPRDVT
jgi:hypothetical protein